MIVALAGSAFLAVVIFAVVLLTFPGPLLNLLFSVVLCLPALKPFLTGNVELGWWGEIMIRDLNLNGSLLDLITDLLAGAINMRLGQITVRRAKIRLSFFKASSCMV